MRAYESLHGHCHHHQCTYIHVEAAPSNSLRYGVPVRMLDDDDDGDDDDEMTMKLKLTARIDPSGFTSSSFLSGRCAARHATCPSCTRGPQKGG